MDDTAITHADMMALTADIVAAHLSNNTVSISDVPMLIAGTFAALAQLGTAPRAVAVQRDPAVPVKASVKADHIVCLEDGKKLKMLKRHLMTSYGLTPDAYRAKWNLPSDYPMVAPSYAERRRDLAIRIGLGNKRPATAAAPAAAKKTRTPRKATDPAKG